jgi:hypothetical protein
LVQALALLLLLLLALLLLWVGALPSAVAVELFLSV